MKQQHTSYAVALSSRIPIFSYKMYLSDIEEALIEHILIDEDTMSTDDSV